MLAERNLKLREELELLRHQQTNEEVPKENVAATSATGNTSTNSAAAKNTTNNTTNNSTIKTAVTKKSTSSSSTTGNGKGKGKSNGGVDWWDKNYAMQGKTNTSARAQRPQSAGRVKSDRAGAGTGGGTNAYANTLRPQRRPGSAGRTRQDTTALNNNKKTNGGTTKAKRPTTAPGRRREDQATAHGMSDQMVDAASEEVRLRALMNDVNWDGT